MGVVLYPHTIGEHNMNIITELDEYLEELEEALNTPRIERAGNWMWGVYMFVWLYGAAHFLFPWH